MNHLPWLILITFLSPYALIQIAHERNLLVYLRDIFIKQMYVVCTHTNRLKKTVLTSTCDISLSSRRSKIHSLIIPIYPLVMTWRYD